jgi:hypothetical protein
MRTELRDDEEIMTRSMAIERCRKILDNLVETEIKSRNYDSIDERRVRFAMSEWKASRMRDIERWVDATAQRC